DGVRAEPLLGQLEAQPGARARLEEEVRRGQPAQGGNLRDRPVEDFAEGLGRVQDGEDLVGRQVLETQEILAGADHGRISPIETPSRSSTSVTCTMMTSRLEVGTFFPTKSARIGISRCPRSTMTASWIALGRPRSISSSSAARTVRPV